MYSKTVWTGFGLIHVSSSLDVCASLAWEFGGRVCHDLCVEVISGQRFITVSKEKPSMGANSPFNGLVPNADCLTLQTYPRGSNQRPLQQLACEARCAAEEVWSSGENLPLACWYQVLTQELLFTVFFQGCYMEMVCFFWCKSFQPFTFRFYS